MLFVAPTSSSPLLCPRISQEDLSRIAQIFQVNLIDRASKEDLEKACFISALEACRQGRWEQIASCKSELAQITDQQGRSILLCAIQSGERTLYQKLIAEGITLQTNDLEGNTPLHYAALSGDVDLIAMLYKHIFIDSKNNNGETPLHLAIRAGQSDVVKALLINGAQKEARFNYETIEVTPLGYAVIRGELESVQILCKEINPSTTQTSIGNVLHLAVHFQQNDVLWYLLKNHAQDCKTLLEQKDLKGHTPFALAVLVDNSQALDRLRVFGANIEATNNLGQTPFHLAAEQRNSRMIEILDFFRCQIAPTDFKHKRPLDLIVGDNDSAISARALVQNLMQRSKNIDEKPPQYHYQPPENLVFKGGGPKGIAYLGAVKVLYSKGALKYVKRVAGTSAGAINSTLMAFNYSYDEMLDLLGSTSIESWLDHPLTVKSLKESIKKNLSIREAFEAVKKIVKYYATPIGLVTDTFRALWHCTGGCEGKVFQAWIEASIAKKSGIHLCTFGELRGLIEQGKPFRHLHVIASRLEPSQIFYFNSEDKQWDDVIISDAVRASMSIPIAFVPHIIHKKINGKRTPCPELGFFVDGGLLYNLPIEIFDRKKFLVQDIPEEEKNCVIFNKRTLGFSLYSQEEKELPDPEKIETVGKLLKTTVGLFYKAEDLLRQMNPYNMHRVIEIDNQGVDLLEFALSDEKKTKLIQSGERATTGFYEKLGEEVQKTGLFYHQRDLKQIQGAINVKPPHAHFVGRKALLQDLDKILLDDVPRLSRVSKIHVLYGPGGVGKSELAISFANNHLDDFSLLWSISCGAPEEMENGYRDLASTLKVYLENHDSLEVIVRKVHNRLAQNKGKPWLIIFDNLNDSVPFPERGGVVLITSYRKKPDFEGTEVLPFSREEALELLQTVTKQESPHVNRLLEFSGCYPILLGQIGSYLARTGMSVEEYTFLLEQKVQPIQILERNPKTLEIAMELTLQRLPYSALKWLYACSHLNPSAIPLLYLETWLNLTGFQNRAALILQREDIKTALVEHALLRFDPEMKMFSMHLDIKKVLQPRAKLSSFNEAIKILVFFGVFSSDVETTKNWTETMRETTLWVSHSNEILKIAKQTEYTSILLIGMGKWEFVRGHYLEALKYYTQALEIKKVALGDKHPDLAESLNGMANCYFSQGNYAEAFELYSQALEIWKAVFGNKHPGLAESLNGMANCYDSQGNTAEAFKLYSQALEILKAALGDKHPHVALSLNNMANCYDSQGNHAEAFKLYSQALEILKAALGDNHPNVATSLNNMANCYYSQGNTAEAFKLHSQALEILKAALGDKHPDVAASLGGIANCYYSQGNTAEAFKLHSQALEILKAALGDKHPDVAASLNNMANCHSSQGNYTEARKLRSQAREIKKEALL
jgi:tetratricopeptide (TPR) repeat protein/ankyrin repeat protein/predicted acylesterase/phospholipase RssA